MIIMIFTLFDAVQVLICFCGILIVASLIEYECDYEEE